VTVGPDGLGPGVRRVEEVLALALGEWPASRSCLLLARMDREIGAVADLDRMAGEARQTRDVPAVGGVLAA
jgi:hypothetical protein